MRHFNEEQAISFMKLNNIKFKIEDIQHVTALNSLLLSLAQNCKSLTYVETNVDAIAKSFLKQKAFHTGTKKVQKIQCGFSM